MITRRVMKRTTDSILRRSFFDTIRYARHGPYRHTISSPTLNRFEALEYDGPAWVVVEDYRLFTAVTQELGYNSTLMNKSDGHILNWDFIANFVNMKSRHYRSPRQCFMRFQILNQIYDSSRNPSEPRKNIRIADHQRLNSMKKRLEQEAPRNLMQTIQNRYKLIGELASKRFPVYKRVPNEIRYFHEGKNPPQQDRRLAQSGMKQSPAQPSDIRVRMPRIPAFLEDVSKGRHYKSLYSSKTVQQFPPTCPSAPAISTEAKQKKSVPTILNHKTQTALNRRAHPIPNVSDVDGVFLEEIRLSPIPREMYTIQPRPQPNSWQAQTQPAMPMTAPTAPTVPSYRPQIVANVGQYTSNSPMLRRVQPGVSYVNASTQHIRPMYETQQRSTTGPTEIIVHSIQPHAASTPIQQQQQHQTYYQNVSVQHMPQMQTSSGMQAQNVLMQSHLMSQQQPQQQPILPTQQHHNHQQLPPTHSYNNEEENPNLRGYPQ